MTRAEGLRRLRSYGLSAADAETLWAHFDAAERSGRSGHGHERIDWLASQTIEPGARPRRLVREAGYERWSGRGTLGYLVLAAVVRDVVEEPPGRSRLIVCEDTFPTGVLGYWARQLAEAGLVALITATSPRRLPPPGGGEPLTGTNPLAIGVPSASGDPIVCDVSMGAVTHGDVLTGRATPDELVPFGGPLAHKAFALAVGLELFVGALAGPAHGAVVLVARPDHDVVPALRELARGVRLPGDPRPAPSEPYRDMP